MFNALLQTLYGPQQNQKKAELRLRYGLLEAWVSIVANFVLFALKLVIALIVNSAALLADAVHSLSDSASSLAVIIGLKMAHKPSDVEHPFGHGRVEFVTALVVSGFIFLAGYELLIHAVISLANPQVTEASWLMIILVFGTLVLKELLARFSWELARLSGSTVLKADGAHHRSDAISTALVLLAMLGSRYGLLWLDGVCGVLVSLYVFYAGYEIAKEAISQLIGEAPSGEEVLNIAKLAKSQKNVLGVHDIICHNYGHTQLVSLHLEVSDQISVLKAHEIAERVEHVLRKDLGAAVVVHIDPITDRHPDYEKTLQRIESVIQDDSRIEDFYELRISGDSGSEQRISFSISLSESTDEQLGQTVQYALNEQLSKRFSKGTVFKISVAPRFAY